MTLPAGHRMPPKKKPKPKGTRAHRAKVGVVCGAKKRGGGKCLMAAGWGTSHPGIGKCKLHGGAAPNHVKAAAKEEYRKLLGNPIETTPEESILTCVKIRAGEVKWLSDRMAELQEQDWIENTMVGKQFHLYARERQHALNDLARFSAMAISMNIAERTVRLAETYAELLANYTKAILDDLWPHLDAEGRATAPQIVRRHLIALDGGMRQPELPPVVAA